LHDPTVVCTGTLGTSNRSGPGAAMGR